VEVTGEPSTPLLGGYFELVTIDLSSNIYPDGYRSEINLAALDWLSMVANPLQRGYLVTIDYGYPAERYYSPGRGRYSAITNISAIHINIGRQDITAHVDFTALEVWGEVCGLDTIGFTQQGCFNGFGLGERPAALIVVKDCAGTRSYASTAAS